MANPEITEVNMTKNTHNPKTTSKKTTKTARRRKTAQLFPFVRPARTDAIEELTVHIEAVWAAVTLFRKGASSAEAIEAAIKNLSDCERELMRHVVGAHDSGRYFRSPIAALGSLLQRSEIIGRARQAGLLAIRDARRAQRPLAKVIDLVAIRAAKGAA